MYDENDIYAVFEEEAVDLIDRFGQLAESLEAASKGSVFIDDGASGCYEPDNCATVFMGSRKE